MLQSISTFTRSLDPSLLATLTVLKPWRAFSAQAQSLPTMPPFNHVPTPYKGPSKQEVIALRKKYLSPGAFNMSAVAGSKRPSTNPQICASAAMFWHFREPVMITEGRMQYLYDENGRRYLDVGSSTEAVKCDEQPPWHSVLQNIFSMQNIRVCNLGWVDKKPSLCCSVRKLEVPMALA
jgi:hypothetical protein